MDDWVSFKSLKKSLYTIDDLKNSGDENKKKFVNKKCLKYIEDIEHSEDEGLDPKE